MKLRNSRGGVYVASHLRRLAPRTILALVGVIAQKRTSPNHHRSQTLLAIHQQDMQMINPPGGFCPHKPHERPCWCYRPKENLPPPLSHTNPFGDSPTRHAADNAHPVLRVPTNYTNALVGLIAKRELTTIIIVRKSFWRFTLPVVCVLTNHNQPVVCALTNHTNALVGVIAQKRTIHHHYPTKNPFGDSPTRTVEILFIFYWIKYDCYFKLSYIFTI
jgi:hypothetical protein